ncbi:hypothetical protein TNCV_1040831 [Trichonephila clavipes]|nr:hypothetical protein TNCV_1040831 [Trichonephila clavipes]
MIFLCVREPCSEKLQVNDQIDDWLQQGIIRESCSDYCSPIVLCKKKDGNLRICIDYRKINSKTDKDRYPLPLIEEVLDQLGPLPSTNKNYNHILSIIDAFTKFVWLYPLKSTSSRDAPEKLKQQEITFGNPHRIITDKGTAFTSKEFREYCENENIQHLSITTGIPRGNGQIERNHSSLIPILSKLSIDDASKWYKFVPAVQRTLNSTISRSTQMTPFQLLTGVKMRTKKDLEILKLLEEEIVETFTENREKIREEAKRNILKMQEESCRNFNKKRKKARTSMRSEISSPSNGHSLELA